MSDFFMPNQKKNEIVNQEAEKYRTEASNIQNNEIEEYKQKRQEHLKNWDRYGVEVPDEYYDAFNKIISQAPTPEEAQEEAYKIGSAVKYSKAMDIPLLEAYKNVDAFNEAQFTDLQDQKSRFEALSDMLTLGGNNVKLGRLGNELMQAHINNDTELANSLMAQIDAINQQNQLMQDNAPRSWVMQALEAGAQSLPFTGVVAGAGIVGNFIAPIAGTGASFAASSYLSAGTEYIDMIANGASPETARLVAAISGGIQGLIEADFGITKGIVKGSSRLLGKKAVKEVTEGSAKKGLEEIGRKVFKRFHFGAGKKVLINYLENRGKDILGEGTEEFLQEITSIVGQEVAASLDGYDIPDDDLKSIVKQTTEAFKGGVLGALSMGFIPAGINAAADIKDYKLIRDTAEAFESEEMFKNVAKDSPVFEGMSDKAKTETIHEVWQRAQNRKEEEANLEAQKIAEGRDAAEGAEEAQAENEDGQTEVYPVARDDTGRLITKDEVYTDENGNTTGGTFRVGDTSKSEEEGNRYGYIKYSTAENGDITIDSFKMTEGREQLRGEVFEEFAREHPDVNIEWNVIGSDMQNAKQELIRNNPSGAKNGLRYFTTADIDDIATRKSLFSEIRENVHNYKPVKYFDENNQAKIRYEQSELTNEQLATAVEVIELRAKHVGLSITDYMNKRYKDGKLFGNPADITKSALAQKQNPDTINGGIKPGKARENWQKDGMYIKGVIYAAQNADFATLIHELSHGFRAELTGQELADAEAAFDVKDGDWDVLSKYKGPDGEYLTKEEAFAYFGQDYFITGKAPTPQMENIFKRLAKYLAEALSRLSKHLEFSPEIAKVFNNLLANDDSVYNKALKAAQEEEGEYRAKLKREAEEKQEQKKAEAEQAKKQAEAEREEAAEGTDFAENAPTAEDLLKGIEEAENETKENQGETNAIDNALKDLPLTDEQKAETAEVLKDETSTRVEKAEAVTEAAASVYEEEITPEDNEEKSNSILNGESVHDINTKELNIDVNNLKESGLEYIRNNPQGIAKTNIGDIEINESGVRASLSHTLYENKVYAIPAIKDVLEKGTYLGVLKDLDGKKQNNYYFAAPITIDGKKQTLFIRVKHVAGRNKLFYIHDVFTDEEIKEAAPYSGEQNANLRSLRGAALAKSIIQDYEKYNKIQNDKMYFQTVYHGSGADFDKFDTENYGLSGEGSMSFGYGTYVTDSEEIARDYANRAKQKNGRTFNLEASKLVKVILEDMKKGISFEESYLQHKDKYIQMAQDYINDLEKNTYFKPEDKEIYKKAALTSIQQIENLKNEDLAKGYLYTAEIPDNGYIEWDRLYKNDEIPAMAKALRTEIEKDYSYGDAYIEWDYLEELENHAYTMSGANLLNNIKAIFYGNEKEKKASKYLNRIGYAGIKYPAGTIHGNGNGAYNYVIFNDDDAQIMDKLLFQTNAELMDEARQFASWQEFMNYCQLSDDEQNAFENDEAWYKSFWEQANAITQEEEKQAEAEERKQEAEADTPEMVDRLFISYIKNNPEVVDNFVQQVSDIMEMDLGGDEWAQVDEEGGRERERYAVLQDYISAELRDGNWQTAIAKVQGGHEITDYIRKRLVTEMTDSYKARDFRNLYAAVMKEKRFTVDALDTRAAEIERKLEKYSKRYYDIVAPTEDVTVTTPQRRKQIALEMQNRDLAARIKAGSLKVDDEVYNYLKSVEKKENDLKKQEAQLTEKIQNLYNDVGNIGLQQLIRVHEQLMEQKTRLSNFYKSHQLKVEKGLRMTDRYTRQTQEMTQTYHELERKFSDLKDSLIITEDVQKILDTQERRREIREEAKWLAKDMYLAEETKKIRINLVKQLFKKVDLAKVDFKQAQQIIAIQKLTMPNMIGGVNRWIGRKSPFLNAVLSRIVTDSEYKERILNYLSHVEKQNATFNDFVESIRNAKSREDFEHWGVAEREYAIKYLPKENWVWDLKLKEKARELQESLQLDITQEKVERLVYDADGHPVEDDEGGLLTEEAYKLRVGDEALNKLLQETLGDELYNRLLNSPMVEWSTQEMEELVACVNQLRDEGITMRAAKLEARKREAQKFVQQIEQAVKDTGITINPDDTPEEKEKKLKKINKILGKNKNLKGTEAGKDSGFIAKLDRILHGYKDANVLRVTRILDNQSEGVNTYLLYRKEDNCYNAKMRSIMNRGEVVHKVMATNKITEGDLAKSVRVAELGTEFTNDELLFFLAADKDFKLDENGKNDNYAATSRNAVCFGNMMSDSESQELKEGWAKLDKEMNEAIEKDILTPEQRQLLANKQLDTRPGTTAYINECNRRWDIVIKKANELLNEKPGYKALLEAIQADYADQYERMNEVSINEFNVGVNRVKCYVPLVRREQNGASNENQVMEDLLAINGVSKNGVNKGMTQSRQSISPLHQRPVQTGLFRTWCDSVERTEHFIAYAPYVRLLNRVYKNNDAQYLRRTIEGRYGKGMLDYIDAYISEVANPNAQNTRSSGAELLHILRGKTAPAYLGWKASAIIKQGLTSPWPYMQFVNPAEYLKAAFKCNNPKMWEAIQEKSVFMKNRRMDPINDLVDEMSKNAKNKVDKFWSNFTKTGMQGLEFIDWACVAPGWYACYTKKYNQLQKASEARYNAKMAELEERNRSGNGEVLTPSQMETIAKQELLEDIEIEAVTYADDCTRQCQPSNRLTDLAPLFKDKNEFMRAFLQFQTSLNVIWQNLRYDMPYAVKNKEFTRIAGTVIGYVMAGIFMNSVMEGIGGDDDDDDTQALRKLIYYSATQFTDAVPILGSEITNVMDKVITGKRAYAQSGTDMTPSATKLLTALQNTTSGNWKKAAELTAEGIGLYLGAPVSGTKEIYKLLGKPLSEGDVNFKRGISDVYGIAGDILEE